MDKPTLTIIGTDGNAFALLAKARRVALANGMDWPKIQAEATDGDYDHLLTVLGEYYDIA